MKIATLALGILLCSAAIAEPQPWMKKENPETLSTLVIVGSACPFSQSEVQEVVNGVLIRSRLRPGYYATDTDWLGFVVKFNCKKIAGLSEQVIFNLDVNFIRFYQARTLVEPVPNYGILGNGTRDFILEATRGPVEELVTDYLQANFDLAPE
jgi:hypothetical protein